MSAAPLLYGYAVLPAAMADDPRVRSVDADAGPAVEVIRTTELGLAVGRVPVEEFGQDNLETNLGDADWVSRLALDHFDVVARLFAIGPVLPLRLGTLYRSAETAVATLDANREVLDEALRRLTGAAQWSVRVTARRPARRPVEADSGTGYLQGLARARQDDTEDRETRGRLTEKLAERLRALAMAVDNPAQLEPGALHAAAYLVRNDEAHSFLDAVRGFTGPGIDLGLAVDVRGPWPPYSFVPALQQEHA